MIKQVLVVLKAMVATSLHGKQKLAALTGLISSINRKKRAKPLAKPLRQQNGQLNRVLLKLLKDGVLCSERVHILNRLWAR